MKQEAAAHFPEKYIWDFLGSSSLLKKFFNNRKQLSMMDLGCRHGNSLFHGYHQFGFHTCRGIDLSPLEYMVSDSHFFNKYNQSLNEPLNDIFTQEFHPQKILFSYYQLVVKQKMGLNPLTDWESFVAQFQIRYQTSIEDYLNGKGEEEKFDLLVLGKVLHYKSLKDPPWVVQEAVKLLREDGVLFLKSWVKDFETELRRNVRLEDVEEWIKGLKVLSFLQEGELIYLFLKK